MATKHTESSRTREVRVRGGEDLIEALSREGEALVDRDRGVVNCGKCSDPTPKNEIQRVGGKDLCTRCQPVS